MFSDPKPQRRRRVQLTFVLLVLGVVTEGAAQQPTAPQASNGGATSMPPPLARFLQQTIRLSRAEMGAAVTGTPVAKVVKSADSREIVVFGVVRVDVPRSFYVMRAVDFPSSLRVPSRSRFGFFASPPSASDVAAFSLPHGDVNDLAKCRPGSCSVKLSAKGIADLHARISRTPRLVDSIANAFFRGRTAGYMTAYRGRGNAGLIVYDDQQTDTPTAQVLKTMLGAAPYMYQYPPSLERYLENYPADRPAGLREVLFWSEDDLPSLKPTFTVVHEVVYSPPELPGSTLIAAKQLYADHYLDGALDLTAAVDQAVGQPGATGGIYLVLIRRWHFDSDFPGGWLLNVRGKVSGSLSDRTIALLRDDKSRSERAYAAAHPPSAHEK